MFKPKTLIFCTGSTFKPKTLIFCAGNMFKPKALIFWDGNMFKPKTLIFCAGIYEEVNFSILLPENRMLVFLILQTSLPNHKTFSNPIVPHHDANRMI